MILRKFMIIRKFMKFIKFMIFTKLRVLKLLLWKFKQSGFKFVIFRKFLIFKVLKSLKLFSVGNDKIYIFKKLTCEKIHNILKIYLKNTNIYSGCKFKIFFTFPLDNYTNFIVKYLTWQKFTIFRKFIISRKFMIFTKFKVLKL